MMEQIGKYVVIDRGVQIGDWSVICHFVYLKEGTKIGRNCYLGSYVRTGERCVIGDNTIIKCRTTISPDVVIGKDCFIGPHSILLHGDVDGSHKPSRLGDNVYLGTGVIVNPGVVIESILPGEVVVGSGALVTRSITEPGVYVGSPARRIRK